MRPDSYVTLAVALLVLVATVAILRQWSYAEHLGVAALSAVVGWSTLACYLKNKPIVGTLGLLAPGVSLLSYLVVAGPLGLFVYPLLLLPIGPIMALLALVGAGQLAKPDSWWARHLYDAQTRWAAASRFGKAVSAPGSVPPAADSYSPPRSHVALWLVPIVIIAGAGVAALIDSGLLTPDSDPPSRVEMSGQDLSGHSFSNENLVGAAIVAADLTNAHLDGVNAAAADFHDSVMRGVQAHGANFERANLRGVDLSGADLRSANLRVAKLEKANLSGADLSNADLRGASMGAAQLDATDLMGARLGGADLDSVRYDAATTWPQDYTPPPMP